MNVDKTRISRKSGMKSDPEFGLDGRPGNVDRENVLDLLTVIEDERRYRAAAALLIENPLERHRYNAMTREDMALVANVRHGLAHVMRRHMSSCERARQLEIYARQLMARSQRPHRRALLPTTNLQRGEP